MSDRVEDLLAELSNAPGPVGFEGPVRAIVRRELDGVADASTITTLRDLLAAKP